MQNAPPNHSSILLRGCRHNIKRDRLVGHALAL
jgi:hypothetical protein